MTAALSQQRPSDAIEVALPPAPYPGLRPFETSEWPTFFGRERIVADLRRRLTRQRLVMVHGSSGCGKSSVIRAGLLPRLVLDQARAGSSAWRTAIMRPGGSPLWHLSQAIAAVTDPPADERARQQHTLAIRRTLNLGTEALPELTIRFDIGRSGPVCLLLDQFEELFTHAREASNEEALTFVEVLRGFANEPPPGVHAVLTMRSDHLGDCGRYLGFAELVNRTQYLVPRMSDADLMRAIREPARLYDGEVTLELAMRLVQDAAGEADALPLVQHCLMRLWQQVPTVDFLAPGSSEASAALADQPDPADAPPLPEFADRIEPVRVVLRREGAGLDQASTAFAKQSPRRVRLLDLPAYPGLREGLSRHADEVLAKRSGFHIETVERVFRALADVDVEGRVLRRRLTVKSLAAEIETSIDRVNSILLPFRSSDVGFIEPLGRDRLKFDDVVSIAHEALLRCWSRLNDPTLDRDGCPNGWLQREREGARVWRVLKTYAEAFDHFGETLSTPMLAVYHRSQQELLGGEEWAKRYGGSWRDVERLLSTSKVMSKLKRLVNYSWLIAIATFTSLTILFTLEEVLAMIEISPKYDTVLLTLFFAMIAALLSLLLAAVALAARKFGKGRSAVESMPPSKVDRTALV